MLWLRRIAQAPPSYTGIGHGYEWTGFDEYGHPRYEEKFIKETIILWWLDGRLHHEETVRTESTFHAERSEAMGRIEKDKNVGSIYIWSAMPNREQKRLFSELITTFPGVKFYVYNQTKGQPLALQYYYESI